MNSVISPANASWLGWREAAQGRPGRPWSKRSDGRTVKRRGPWTCRSTRSGTRFARAPSMRACWCWGIPPARSATSSPAAPSISSRSTGRDRCAGRRGSLSEEKPNTSERLWIGFRCPKLRRQRDIDDDRGYGCTRSFRSLLKLGNRDQNPLEQECSARKSHRSGHCYRGAPRAPASSVQEAALLK
jgi:hypothetical protein